MQWVVEGLEDVARPEKPQLASAPVKPVERADAGEKETLKEKKKRKKKKKVVIDQLSAEEMAEFTAEQERRGIVYISRVPPFMKPDKIRRELSQFGTVMRIFLTPEARSSHLKRKRFRGNSKIKYVDGWVEFDSKKDAKMVALSMNARPIGGKKRSYYHDDLWNLKYLPGFKWRHLTESVTEARMEKADKLQTELAEAKKERGWYLAKVEQAKGIERKEERLTAKGGLKEKTKKRQVRSFRQRQVVGEDAESEAWIKSTGDAEQPQKKRRRDSGEAGAAAAAAGGDSGAQKKKRRTEGGANEYASAKDGKKAPAVPVSSLFGKIFAKK